jgi:5-methylcytosine-specific restriction endonuclease McrA
VTTPLHRRSAALQRRTALKRSEKRLKRTRLNPIGKKGREHRDRMRAVRPTVIERAEGLCQAGFVLGCTGRAEQVHHVLPTERGGSDRLDNLIAVCEPCHFGIHNIDPIEAGRRGLLRGKDAGR